MTSTPTVDRRTERRALYRARDSSTVGDLRFRCSWTDVVVMFRLLYLALGSVLGGWSMLTRSDARRRPSCWFFGMMRGLRNSKPRFAWSDLASVRRN